MLLVDEDMELLETHLDGALSADEAVALRDRLAREPEFAAVLESLRTERGMRQRLWASLEPTDTKVEQFVQRVSRASAGRSWWLRPLRLVAAVAACVVVSFFAGWQFRGRQVAPTDVLGSVQPIRALAESVVHYQVALTDENGKVTAVQDFNSLEKAREFTQDLSQWQDRQRQMRDGAAVVVADRF